MSTKKINRTPHIATNSYCAQPLPIDALLPEILQLLENNNRLVLQAAPGAGKTTRVPPALLKANWLAGQRILVLEPRRLATRAAARRMAQERGEAVGDSVGYRTRLDTQIGPDTRIEVVTEGVLTRMLQNDPALTGVGGVLFDEFHERSLQADLGLALCLEVQGALRDDLRILVMSATLDGASLSRYLNNAPVLASDGRCYPVEVRYQTNVERADRTPIAAVVRTLHRALAEETGDVLVFLPGSGEISRVLTLLEAAALAPEIRLCPLYGNLDPAQQDAAIRPSPAGQRKIVLATGIAETSLTIEGVRVVVDAGRMRKPRFDPVSGMTRLMTLRVSQAAAEQRRGRAGRTQPGVCYRLWDETVQRSLLAQSTAEILEADLTPLMLELARWGTADPGELDWLDAPPAGACDQARVLLRSLDALDSHGRITAHGQRMAELPLHPRLAHMLLQGKALGMGALACDVAALFGERDLLRTSPGNRNADIRVRLEALRHAGGVDAQVDRGVRQRLQTTARQLRRKIACDDAQTSINRAGLLLALAWPDRIALSRGKQQGRYLLAGGKGAVLDEADALQGEVCLAVAELDGDRREARIYLAAPLAVADLMTAFTAHIEVREQVVWDGVGERVSAQRQTLLGALVLNTKMSKAVDPDQVARVLLDAVRSKGVAALPWDNQARQWQARLAFVCAAAGTDTWPDLSDAALEATLEHWLLPYISGLNRWQDLARLDLQGLLEAQLEWQQKQQLDEWAPTHIVVPSGSRIRVNYDAGAVPVLAVRLQEMFGCTDTPRLAAGRVPVMLHLLSPAQRPVQVTRDLASFWDNTYSDVKKDLKGRYPKHDWPDNPREAQARRRARPRNK